MNENRISVRQICFVGMFAAMIALLAQVSVPLPSGVAVTLQTFAVPLAGIALGPWEGAMAAGAYILLGAAGAPVFTGWRGGLGVLFGMTGGFILSFPFLAWAAGVGAQRGGRVRTAAWLATGMIVNYLCGTVYFCLVAGSDWRAGIAACVLPFLPLDIVKMTLASVFGLRLRRTLKTAGLYSSI